MSLNTNPTIVAADLAAQLRADPIAASQIIEHIPFSELLDLLNLRIAMAEDIAEMIEPLEKDIEDLRYTAARLERTAEECLDCSRAITK
jgi:HEPN domain-containing protein